MISNGDTPAAVHFTRVSSCKKFGQGHLAVIESWNLKKKKQKQKQKNKKNCLSTDKNALIISSVWI